MILVDANIFMYAAGRTSPQRRPCQRFLERIVQDGSAEPACTDAEVLQEILHRYRAIGAAETGFRVFDAAVSLDLEILPVTEEDICRARVLLEAHPGLSTRDAVHLGVMQSRGMKRIASYDRELELVPWVERIEPS